MNNKTLAILLILLLITPQLVSASLFESFKNWFAKDFSPRQIIKTILGRPKLEINTPSDFIFFILVPFLGTFVITYGILTEIRVFKLKRVNIILALLFGFSLLYYGVLTYIVHLLYSIGGFLAVLAFFVIFSIGTFLFGKRKTAEWESEVEAISGLDAETKSALRELKEVEQELRIVREDLTDAKAPGSIKRLKQKQDGLEKRLDDLRKIVAQKKSQTEALRSKIIID